MKRLPKRNSYKPKPRKRQPSDREVIQGAIARLLIGVAKDSGIEISSGSDGGGERKGRRKLTLWF